MTRALYKNNLVAWEHMDTKSLFINILSYACASTRIIIIDIQTNHIPFFLVSKNISGQNLTASGNYTIRKKKNESNTTLLTPAYFSRRRHYLPPPVSDSVGERHQEENCLAAKTFEPYKKR